MTPKLEVVPHPTEPSFITRRWFNAPPELVWKAWTQAEFLRQWMGPRTLECTLYEVDLRVGGGYRFVQRAPEGVEYGFHGVYREISPTHKLVSTFVFEMMPDQEAIDTLTLEAKDGGTLATTHTLHPNMESRDGHLNSGMEAGMADGYLRLDEFLANHTGQRIVPFLWFDGQAEEAVTHYLKIFGEGRVLHKTYYGPGPMGKEGAVMTISFELCGLRMVALNGGPIYHFTPAVSLFMPCDNQEQIDRLWAGLTEGGEESQCGWLKDKWGLSWQICPRDLPLWLGDADSAKAGRAAQAMFGMKKLDIAALQAAHRGDS